MGRRCEYIVEAGGDVDEVVIGSRRHAGADRILLGSVDETTARRATVPVTIPAALELARAALELVRAALELAVEVVRLRRLETTIRTL